VIKSLCVAIALTVLSLSANAEFELDFDIKKECFLGVSDVTRKKDKLGQVRIAQYGNLCKRVRYIYIRHRFWDTHYHTPFKNKIHEVTDRDAPKFFCKNLRPEGYKKYVTNVNGIVKEYDKSSCK